MWHVDRELADTLYDVTCDILGECSESEATLVAGVESDSNSDDCSSSCSYSDTEDETGLISEDASDSTSGSEASDDLQYL